MARVQLPDDIDQVISGGEVAVNGTARFLNTDTGLPVTIYTGRVNGTSTPTGVATVTNGKAVGWVDSGVTLQYYVTPSGSAEQGPFYTEAITSSVPSFAVDAPVNVNTRLRIGSGTGSLTDKPYMGLKVKIDSDATHTPAGIQNSVNVVQGTPTGSVHGVVSVVDLNDVSLNTGDTVSLWGGIAVHVATARNVWGINAPVTIDDGSNYQGAAVGAEVTIQNFDTSGFEQQGGCVHLAAPQVGAVRYGLMVGEALGVSSGLQHSVLVPDGTRGPRTNAFYFGALATGNVPTGVPRFQVDKDGVLKIGNGLASATAVGVQLQRLSEANPRLTIANDGTMAWGNGTAATDATLTRVGSGAIGTGTGKPFWIGTAIGNGGGYLQLWEQTADPAAPAADGARFYTKDNGSGKTQFGVLFATGAFIPIVTQV